MRAAPLRPRYPGRALLLCEPAVRDSAPSLALARSLIIQSPLELDALCKGCDEVRRGGDARGEENEEEEEDGEANVEESDDGVVPDHAVLEDLLEAALCEVVEVDDDIQDDEARDAYEEEEDLEEEVEDEDEDDSFWEDDDDESEEIDDGA